jgi:hypothetical protein
VWSIDSKLLASLQSPQTFGSYTIRLPTGYSLSNSSTYKTATKWQWHGDLHDDGTRPVIEIWTVTLDADHARGDVTAYGEQLLADASKTNVTDYSRGLDETGIDKETGNWVTRYTSKCTLKTGTGVMLPIMSRNYVWIDHGALLIATIYDSAAYSQDSLKAAEAAIWTVHS